MADSSNHKIQAVEGFIRKIINETSGFVSIRADNFYRSVPPGRGIFMGTSTVEFWVSGPVVDWDMHRLDVDDNGRLGWSVTLLGG